MSRGEPVVTAELSGANGGQPGATPELSPAARWMRVYRRRLAQGVAVVSVPIGWEDINLLVSAGCLRDEPLHSRAEVSEALQTFLRLAREA
jgi:hypothetical protein